MKANCQICQDLMPLVHDGVASDASVRFVNEHRQACPACQALPQPELSLPPEQRIIGMVRKRVFIHYVLIACLGLLLFFSISNQAFGRTNLIILPIAGALSYLNQGRKFYKTMILVLLMDLLGYYMSNVSLNAVYIPMLGYMLLYMIGVGIGFLLHFGLRKDEA